MTVEMHTVELTPTLRTPEATPPQSHTGKRNKLGTKMEMIARKYAVAGAKINCITFTFKTKS